MMSEIDYSATTRVLRLIDRPLWIVTAAAGPRRGGLVATWVSQASLDPRQPTMMVALAPTHHTTELILASRSFALHLLTAGEMDYVWRFGLESGRNQDKLVGVETTTAVTGSPILAHCLAWLDCRTVTHYDGGDRLFFWADVVQAAQCCPGVPLTEQGMLAAASAEQKRRLEANLRADIDLLSGSRDAWRARQPQT
jgi:flavin reductase (DIM6/NTAB) family NADH-FMN oxidoreductase RutF